MSRKDKKHNAEYVMASLGVNFRLLYYDSSSDILVCNLNIIWIRFCEYHLNYDVGKIWDAILFFLKLENYDSGNFNWHQEL